VPERGARRAIRLPFLVMTTASLAIVPPARGAMPAQPVEAGASCDDLMRRIKLDTFDEKWDQVRGTADALLAMKPPCPQRPQATLQRALALDQLGRPEDALSAYAGYLRDFCAGLSLDCDRARINRLGLLGRLYQSKKRPEHLNSLLDAMKDPGLPGVHAALIVAGLDEPATRALALPRLLQAWRSNLDEDVKNRVCLATLRIDPARAPCGQKEGTPDDGTARPQLISVEIFSKTENKVQLRMHMPVAMAEMFISALPEEARDAMAHHGVDAQGIFKAIREQAQGNILLVETDEARIRIWLQ
jgi:hypothetical protein